MRATLAALLLCACTARPPALHDDPEALAFRSRRPVSSETAQRVAAEAVGAARRRAAWSEPNHVHAVDGYLFGEARLLLHEYETDPGKFREVDPRDDAVMSLSDAAFTLGQLGDWSRRYGIEWEVQLGRARGLVTATGPDAAAQKLLGALVKAAGKTPAEAEGARATLDAKYRDRR